MKIETLSSTSKEIYIDAGKMTVTVNVWSNLEGASIMVHGSGAELPLRMAGAFRWEEIDVILAALSVARSA
jgi:hypothetical protein